MNETTRERCLKAFPLQGIPRHAVALIMAVGLLLPAGCQTGEAPHEPSVSRVPTAAKVDEFFIVDCALPGRIQVLGGITYTTRRQEIKTAARTCEIRGGEYVAFDRASFASSLKVWLPPAQQGDSAAQTYVGEIYEKGLGVTPDYVTAADWYRRAADKGYSRAAINLGSLYEQGLGVAKDQAQALKWYRAAAGLSELKFEIASAAEVKASQDQVAKLLAELKAKQGELNRTQRELENLRQRREQRGSETDTERRALEKSIAERETRLEEKDRELASLRASLAKLEERSNLPLNPDPGIIGLPLPRQAISFGKYHALVIGSNDYRNLPPLKTAVNDAKEVARVLRTQYGFQVTLLLNANRYDILTALNTLREKLTDEDNLLIYYAGHGELDQRNQEGHWLPVDAEPKSTAYWIPNSTLTPILNTMTVKQLLVVADSCYAGTLTRSALGQLDPGVSVQEKLKLIQVMAKRRSRVVMTSGGVEPVIDNVGGEYSIFARPLIELLQANVGAISGQDIFSRLQLRVAASAQSADARQIPQYAPIKGAGHESGDFFFVRTIGRS